MNFGSVWTSWVVYAPRALKIASRLLQDGLLEPIWTQHGPKLAPSWLKLSLCWPQVGSNLAQVGPMLGPFAGPQPLLGRPWPLLIPPCGLLERYTSLLASQTPNLGPARPNMEPFWASQSFQFHPNRPQNGPLKVPSHTPSQQDVRDQPCD